MENKKKLIYSAITILFVLFFCEIAAWIVLKKIKPYYAKAREVMMGSDTAYVARGQGTIGQPYLLYTSAPHYENPAGIVQNNRDGYRGERIPLRRSTSTPRVLFLGGSTTYSQNVPLAENSYPSQVGRILSQKLNKKVEAINAGLVYATTAEILTHYHFKYRYYKPDVVVINTGGNDAAALIHKYYQPDYSHWRTPMVRFRALRKHARWMLHSKFLSVIIINLFFSDLFEINYFVKEFKPVIPWYDPENTGIKSFPKIPPEDFAFKNNLETVIREIMANGSKLLLVPFRINPNEKESAITKWVHKNEKIIYSLAKQYNIEVAPFPASIIDDNNWADEVHLNTEGARQKAIHIAPFVEKLLQK